MTDLLDADDDFEELSQLNVDPRLVLARVARYSKRAAASSQATAQACADLKTRQEHTNESLARLAREVYDGPDSIRATLGEHKGRLGALEQRVNRKPSPYPGVAKVDDGRGAATVQVERWKAITAIVGTVLTFAATVLGMYLSR